MLSAISDIPFISMTTEAETLFAVWRKQFETRTRRALTKDSTRRQLGFDLAGIVDLSSHCFLCLVRGSAKNTQVKLIAKDELELDEPLSEDDKRSLELARSAGYRMIASAVSA